MANGPMANPKSERARSTSHGMAPSRMSACASRPRAASIRLPTKPGQTPTSAAILPIFLAIFIDVVMTGSEVWSARTTSSSFITLAGEKKCRPITDSGREVTDAISSMLSALVFVARMAPGLTMASSLVNSSFLMSIRSKTASTTMSTSARSLRSSDGVMRAIRCSTSSMVKRPFLALRS